MISIVLVVALAAGALVLALLVGLRSLRRQVAQERTAALSAAQEALAAERHHTVQAAVETVVAIAGEKLSDHRSAAASELDLRSEAITQQFRDVNDELVRTRQLVAELQRDRAEQQGRLEQGLAEAVRASANLAQTTQTLREALASTKARGQWGERMAEDVLRAAGFVEGVNYRRQTAVEGGGIPDFTFMLPRGRVLHMDVKFPLDNYLRSLEAGSDAERTACEGAFLRDVRQRVKEITTRGYIDPAETVEAVVLFIPNESIYAFIHERDPQLVDLALGQQVVLCSPHTLFAVLAVVRQAVDAFMVERTSDEILECLGVFSDQWGRFSTALDTLGKRFESTQKAYDDLAGTRRRQLQRSLDRVDDLRNRRAVPDLEEPAAPVARAAGLEVVPGMAAAAAGGSGRAPARPGPSAAGAYDEVDAELPRVRPIRLR